MPAFRFNGAELNRIAREQWGIRHPVRVTRKRYSEWSGSHSPILDASGVLAGHSIRVGNGDLQEMLATLAHEFQHAVQTEELGYGLYTVVYRRSPYTMERQATLAEKRWAEFLPAIRPTRGVSLSQLLHDHDEGKPACSMT